MAESSAQQSLVEVHRLMSGLRDRPVQCIRPILDKEPARNTSTSTHTFVLQVTVNFRPHAQRRKNNRSTIAPNKQT